MLCGRTMQRYESAEQLDSHMSRLEHRGNMVMGDTRIEALDNSLFDKLQVFDGDISPMLEPNNNAIAIAVPQMTTVICPILNTLPQGGDTITATYADDVKYIDSRTGELCTKIHPIRILILVFAIIATPSAFIITRFIIFIV